MMSACEPLLVSSDCQFAQSSTWERMNILPLLLLSFAAADLATMRTDRETLQVSVDPDGGLTEVDGDSPQVLKGLDKEEDHLAEHEAHDESVEEHHAGAVARHTARSRQLDASLNTKGVINSCADLKVERTCDASQGYTLAGDSAVDMCTKTIWAMVKDTDMECAKASSKCVQSKRRRGTQYFSGCFGRQGRRRSCGSSSEGIPLICTKAK